MWAFDAEALDMAARAIRYAAPSSHLCDISSFPQFFETAVSREKATLPKPQRSSIMHIMLPHTCSRKVRMSCFCKVGMSHSPRLNDVWEIADGIDSDERARSAAD
jgi:hypothetical protein